MQAVKVLVEYKSLRSLVIEFNRVDGESDYDQFKYAFDEVTRDDDYFVQKKKTHFPVFKYVDPDFGIDVEVTRFYKFKETQKLQCHFVPKESPQKQVPTDQKSSSECTTEQLEAVSHEVIQIIETVEGCEVIEGLDSPVVFTIEEAEAAELESRPKKRRYEKKQPKFGPENFPTPSEFSPSVQSILEKGTFLQNCAPFVTEATKFLLDLIPYPTKTEYSNYCQALLTTFPQINFSTGSGDSDQLLKLKKLITTRARNSRRGPQVTPPEKRKRGNLLKGPVFDVATLSSSCSAGTADNESSTVTDDDGLPASVQQTQRSDSNGEARVLSFQERRSKISACPSICDIIKEFPMFQNPDMVTKEFYEVAGMESARFQIVFEESLLRLASMFSATAESAFARVGVFSKLEEALHPNIPKSYTRSITLIDLGNDRQVPAMPSNILSNSPVVVVYGNAASGAMGKVYLLAEDRIIGMKDNPTACDVITLLLGSYYTFDSNYSGISRQFFNFLECILMGKTPANVSVKYNSLMKTYNNNK